MDPITAGKSRLGFVGIGYMGLPIARRLLEAGFKLTAFDREPGKAEQLIQYGGTVARNIAELSYGCDVVMSCLPTDEAVLGTYKGTDGPIANARRGSLVIDMSTGNRFARATRHPRASASQECRLCGGVLQRHFRCYRKKGQGSAFHEPRLQLRPLRRIEEKRPLVRNLM